MALKYFGVLYDTSLRTKTLFFQGEWHMFKLTIFFSLSMMLFSMGANALENANQDESTIEQKLSALRLEKRQAEVMMKKMLTRGRINEEEATHIKREIASAKEEDVKNIRVQALEKLKSTNSFATK